jgi:cyclic pyranopterin phosphate synthase
LASLSLDDIVRLVRVLASLGVTKYKITGGEPTLRPDIVKIISSIRAVSGVKNITLTTNGLLLSKLSKPLAEAGLDSINISLDSLNASSYQFLTRHRLLQQALKGLESAYRTNVPVKINCVPQFPVTEEDLLDLVRVARDRTIHVRFIELMPIGPASKLAGYSPESIKAAIEKHFGPLAPTTLSYGNGPASYFSLKDFKGLIGFINPINSCFCARCNRLRITADGYLKSCLYEIGLKLPLDNQEALSLAIVEAVRQKPERHLFQNHSSELCDRLMNRIGG